MNDQIDSGDGHQNGENECNPANSFSPGKKDSGHGCKSGSCVTGRKGFVAFNLLPDEFTREDVQRVLNATGSNTPLKNVIYKWHLLGCIEDIEKATASNGKQQSVRFRKR